MDRRDFIKGVPAAAIAAALPAVPALAAAAESVIPDLAYPGAITLTGGPALKMGDIVKYGNQLFRVVNETNGSAYMVNMWLVAPDETECDWITHELEFVTG